MAKHKGRKRVWDS